MYDPLEGRTMKKFLNAFRKDENGAVTVDWVVLTAAVVGLAVAAYSSIEDGASTLTANTETFLGNQDPN
jgi:Flp pilus assembly pilin Flp